MKTDISKLFSAAKDAAVKYSPEILIGVGVAGYISSIFIAVAASKKADKEIERKKKELKTDILTPKEKFKTTWKYYLPTVAMVVTSTGCIVASDSIHYKRNLALATACTLSETAFKEYREAVTETVPAKKSQEIMDNVAHRHVMDNPVNDDEIERTGLGDTLCYEPLSGRYFYSDIEKVKAAINQANKHLLNELYISLNDLYSELGLKYNDLGDYVGWNVDKGLIDVSYSSQLAKNDKPCFCIVFNNTPTAFYYN